MSDAAVVTEAVVESPEGRKCLTLDLSVPAGVTARLGRARALASLRGGRTRTSRLRLTWHDSGHGQLAESGRALLEIEEAGRRLWRIEPSCRDGERLWPLGLPASPIAEAADAASLVERPMFPVAPVAILDGRRLSLGLGKGSGVVEIVLREGTLAAGASARKLARLSIYGTPDSVFALAHELSGELGLQVPACSLSGEVLASLHASRPPPPPVLGRQLDVDDAFAHVVSQLAATIVHHAPGAREATAPEPVHQMRVALRRLRSALSLFGRVACGPELDKVRGDLRELARALGPARDWDVFLGGTGCEIRRLLPNEPAVLRLNRAAVRRRAAAYAALGRVLDGPAFQRTLLDLIELAVVRPWRRDLVQDRPTLEAFARHALDRKRRRVIAADEDLSALPAEALHTLRIRCKQLRYTAEFFAPLAPGKQTRRFLRRLATVQERLGQLNDGAVAAELLDELGSRGFAAGIVRGYLAARTAGGRVKAERSWHKFRRVDPFWQ